MKNKFTKNEIRLYEVLAKLSEENSNLQRLIGENITLLVKEKSKEWDIFTEKLMDNMIIKNKILNEAKIPKKFMILENLK